MTTVGVVTGLSQYYSDGVERQEIWVDKRLAAELPFIEGRRVSIRLIIGAHTYAAGIRATLRNSYVWISPDLYDDLGNKIRLADALRRAGIEKNQRVDLRVRGTQVLVCVE